MDERCVVAGALVEGRGIGRVANINESMMAPMELTPEQKEKYKAENEAREKEYRRQRVLTSLLEVAERLVMRGKKPEEALSIASEFISRAGEVVNNFTLPD